jgi:hypothetical protein
LSPEAAIAATQLHLLVAEFAHELDANNGQGIDAFYTEDGLFYIGGRPVQGRADIVAFYRERVARLAREQKDGIRVSRHIFTNIRIAFQDETHADVDFISLQYAGEGAPPVRDVSSPTSVADCRMRCRKEADGVWRVAEFDGAPVFLGQDAFLNKSLGRS